MGSGDPRHSFSALVDPEGAYLSNTIQSECFISALLGTYFFVVDDGGGLGGDGVSGQSTAAMSVGVRRFCARLDV